MISYLTIICSWLLAVKKSLTKNELVATHFERGQNLETLKMQQLTSIGIEGL